MTDSELAQIIAFAESNGKVCPMPPEWTQLWELLPGKHRVGGGWHPPLPLILAAWGMTSAIDKRARLRQHLVYAAEHGVLPEIAAFLRGLPAERWLSA